MRLDQLLTRLGEYREWVRLAEAQSGKGLLTQAREILALKRAGGRCGITDYYWFKLYDDGYLRGRGSADFLGWRLQDPFNFALNPRHAVLPAWDKLVFHLLATAAGLPVAPVKATFHRGERLPEVLGEHLRTMESALAFLRRADSYPLFAKPAYSQQGVGSSLLSGYDPASDSVLFGDGRGMSVAAFARRLEKPLDDRYHRPACGFLFQEALPVAPGIGTLTGWPAICGVRMVCLNGPEGVEPIGAAWKVATPPNYVDNFHMGELGNLVAEVDLATGAVGRVVDGLWPTANLLAACPGTGRAFAGFRLPGWERLLDACREAGRVFPLMKVHHWDFALTDRGPLMLELNDMGGTQIVQLFGHGLLAPATREFLKRHADRKAHPWINDL